jgi:uncharacterized protein involved in exopolysaccharide biosynthesis
MHDEFSLTQLWRAVVERKGVVALIVAACVLAAGVITLVLPKIYRAETRVFFPESQQQGLPAALTATLGQQAQSLLPALAGLGPSNEAAGLCKAIAESYSVRSEICRNFKLQERFKAEKFQDATKKLGDSTFTAITPEGVLIIRVDSNDPKLSADLANAYTRIVERRYRDAAVARARGEREFLVKRVAQSQQDLGAAEAALERYQKSGKALLVPDEVPPILQKLADARVDQTTAEVELEAARQRQSQAVSQLKRLVEADDTKPGSSPYSVPLQLAAQTISDNPDIAQIRAELVSLEVQLASARYRFSPDHPEYKRLKTQVDETRARLAAEAQKTITAETRSRDPVYAEALGQLVGLEVATIGQEARAQGLAHLVSDLEAKAAGLPDRLLQYSRLAREVRARETVFATLDGQLEAARLKELQEQPVFQVLDEAVPPQRHDRPKMRVDLVVGFLFGVFLGMAVAAALGPATGKSAR